MDLCTLHHRRGRHAIEGVVAIMEAESRSLVPWEGVAQLLRGPRRGWMCGDGDVHDASAIVRQNDQDEQELVGRGWDHEEIRGIIWPM